MSAASPLHPPAMPVSIAPPLSFRPSSARSTTTTSTYSPVPDLPSTPPRSTIEGQKKLVDGWGQMTTQRRMQSHCHGARPPSYMASCEFRSGDEQQHEVQQQQHEVQQQQVALVAAAQKLQVPPFHRFGGIYARKYFTLNFCICLGSCNIQSYSNQDFFYLFTKIKKILSFWQPICGSYVVKNSQALEMLLS
jgi:hypothetical protein